MSKVVANTTMSLDGFIADADDRVGPLFDWYGSGDGEIAPGDQERSFRVTRASADHLAASWSRIGAAVIGRRLFDLTNGWHGPSRTLRSPSSPTGCAARSTRPGPLLGTAT